MYRYSLVGLALAAVVAIGAGVSRGEDEEEISLKDCPPKVQRTLKREATGGKLVEVEVEKEHGKTIYEAEVILDGKEYEVEVLPNGILLSKVLDDDEREGKASGDDDDDDEHDGDVDDDGHEHEGHDHDAQGHNHEGHGHEHGQHDDDDHDD